MFGLFRRQDPRFRMTATLSTRMAPPGSKVIRVRLSKTSEMSLKGNGYFVRKVLVGPDSLDQAVLEVTTNRAHKVTLAVVDGGDLVPARQWEA